MLWRLAWANVWHRKTRAVLSILAVAIGIAMMVTMLSLAHGTLGEVADRMSSVEADLVVVPSNAVWVTGGADFNEKYRRRVEEATVAGRAVVQQVIPVLWQQGVYMAGKEQRMSGVDPAHMPAFLGQRRILEGRLPDADGKFRALLESLRGPDGKINAAELTAEQLAVGCEMLIDQRLAVAGRYKVGDTVRTLGREWRIVGIVEPGVATRVFCPIQTLRQIKFGGAELSTLFYVKLRPEVGKDPLEVDRIARALGEAANASAEPCSSIQHMLEGTFATMYAYIYVASAVAMVVCFLLICVTMYTMVVERTGQIAVLKAMGAGRPLLLGQSLLEASILSVAGTAGGLLLAVLAKEIIERTMPLLTVRMDRMWIVTAVIVGTAGGAVSSLYPGWRAGKIEPAVALQTNG